VIGSPLILLVALLLDAVLGEPKWLWSRAPHPAVLMGNAVKWMDNTFNRGHVRRIKGSLSCAVLVLAAGGVGWVFSLHWLPEVLLTAVLLAQRSLVDHVRAVADALRFGVVPGRRSVAMIVGRDTAELTEPGIARAAIESAAENFGDGVVAPVFWFLVGGLPGLMIYKMTNTADSMIGYRTPRHLLFGWASARFDDVLNWVPARLTAVLIAITHGVIGQWTAICRDAPLHRSPNAGWPEAAMAQSLDVALSGPRSYEGRMQPFAFVHPEGQHDIGPLQIVAAVRALWRSWAFMVALIGVLCLLTL
jgi:adenosylcobinamide-phosphate synthase